MVKKLNKIIFFVSIFIVIFFISILLFFNQDNFFCGDGTHYGTCSQNKPYFCDKGILMENPSFCFCPSEFDLIDGICVSKYFNSSKKVSVYYYLKGDFEKIDLVLYEEVIFHLLDLPRFIVSKEDSPPDRAEFELIKINDGIQREALLPLVVEIQNLAPNSKIDQIRIASSIVQNFEYDPNLKNLTVLGGKYSLEISNYPYQVLYEGKGACEDKSELLVFLFKELGFKSALFYFPELNHQAVGIACPISRSFRYTGYCFVESTIPVPLSFSKAGYLDGLGYSEIYGELVVIPVSEGDSLGFFLKDYSDANFLERIFYKNELDIFEQARLKKLREKYGLDL